MKVKFAVVSVREGRKGLLRRIKKGERVKVRLEGELYDDWSGDDGVDQAFSMEVTKVEEIF